MKLFIRGLCFIVLTLSVCSSTNLIAQVDSLQRDSIAKVIETEEIATLIPSHYASLNILLTEHIIPEITAANSVVTNYEIKKMERDFSELARLTDYVISRNNILEGIETLSKQWANNLDMIKESAEVLKERTNDLVSLKRELAEERRIWVGRAEKLKLGTHPPEIDHYVTSATDTITSLLSQGALALDTITVMYTYLTELQLKTQEYVTGLSNIRRDKLLSLLTLRAPYIWEVGIFAHVDAFNEQLDYIRSIGIQDSIYYFKEHQSDLFDVLVFFIVIMVIIYWTRRKSMELNDEEEPPLVRNAHILGRPMTMSILFTLIANTFMLPNKPPLLGYVFSFLILYCILSILVNMVSRKARWIAYTLALLFVLLEINLFIGGDNQEARWLTFVTTVVLFLLLYWMRQHRRTIAYDAETSLWRKKFAAMSTPLLLLSGVAVIGNIVGYAVLAELINKGVLFAIIIGLLLVAMYHSLASIIFHFLQTKFATRSVIIREDGLLIFNRTMQALAFTLMVLYLYYCLNFFLLWDFTVESFSDIWNFGHTFGTVNLTIGSLVNIFIIVFVFWLIAAAVKTLMHRELFTRIILPRGVGNAMASITSYSLIVVGVFLSLAAAGFELKHLGLLAGALGVGIGFGLQNIVNNFISGLILVFERPITVDDVVEVDDVLGTVTHIGIRASRIREFNGDEVIVPNADLITKRVINRTLSDTKRRYTMTFETGRDVDPERVIRIATEGAQAVDGILSDPPVKGYFKGMGMQSINFYVNYWGTGNFLDLMSNVESAVYSKLESEGVKMPIPVQIEIQKSVDD